MAAQERNEHVELSVSDTGCGIPPEVAQRIFTPFYSTKGGKGVGLGLVVAASLVRAVGGVVTFDTEAGRGTTFIVSIPWAGG